MSLKEAVAVADVLTETQVKPAQAPAANAWVQASEKCTHEGATTLFASAGSYCLLFVFLLTFEGV